MGMDELRPKSHVLREAMAKAREGKLDDEMLLSFREVCRRLSISKWKLYRHMKEGKIESVKDGRRRLFEMGELRRFVRELKANGDSSREDSGRT
jgi:excisionase family DNA binding protein